MGKPNAGIGKKQLAAMKMDVSAFAALGGEAYQGLNILKLAPGEGAGPFKLVKILLKQKLGKGAAAAKRKPVDVYVAADASGVEIRMPVAASFVGKATDAGLAVGDTFAVLRTEDYESQFKTKGAGYALRVISRAKK